MFASHIAYCTVTFSRSFLACAFIFLIFLVSPPVKWKETSLFTFHLFVFFRSRLIKDGEKKKVEDILSYPPIRFLFVQDYISVDEYFVLIYAFACKRNVFMSLQSKSTCASISENSHTNICSLRECHPHTYTKQAEMCEKVMYKKRHNFILKNASLASEMCLHKN